MTKEQFEALRPGDLVRHRGDAHAYVVHTNFHSRITAIRAADLTNPAEWDVVNPDGSVRSIR